MENEINIVAQSKNYKVFFEQRETSLLLQKLSKFQQGTKVMVVTDENVWRFHGEKMTKLLRESKVNATVHVMEPSEKSKSLTQAEILYHLLSQENFARTDYILAFGGGVVGDLTGFVAATYLRGMKFIQIPTSLLSQVDSSIGGKVAVNLEEGKNLVGCFYHPEWVYINNCFLETLPIEEWRNGMAEVIKVGLIWDFSFFEELEREKETFLFQNPLPMIQKSIQIKQQVVEQDERDEGIRMILNFGHTFGHAFEKQGHFKELRHGESVSLGMLVALQMGEKIGFTDHTLRERVKTVLEKFHLPTEVERYVKEESYEILKNDKKIRHGILNMVLLEKEGKAVLHPISVEQIKEVMTCS